MTAAKHAFSASIADIYDRQLGPAFFEPYARDLARHIDRCPPGPVLETACGTGILTRQLRLHLCRSVQLIATDVNQGMIDYAQPGLDGLERVHWQVADAASLPFSACTFAALACQFGMMFVPDRDAAFREAWRVLAGDGVLAFSVWDSLACNPCCRIAHETISGFFPDNPPDFFRAAFGLHDRRALTCGLAAHGFTDVRLNAVALEVCSPSAAMLAVGQVRGTPLYVAIQQRGIAVDQVVHAVAEALSRLGGDRPFKSTMQALVVTARKPANGATVTLGGD